VVTRQLQVEHKTKFAGDRRSTTVPCNEPWATKVFFWNEWGKKASETG